MNENDGRGRGRGEKRTGEWERTSQTKEGKLPRTLCNFRQSRVIKPKNRADIEY